MNRWIKKRFRILREKFGNKCKICGGTTNLHFAHITSTGLNGKGRGRKERYYDIIKNPECYILACKNCHTDYDAGLLKYI